MKKRKAAAPRGRPRSFDIEKALDQALQVFWQKGYEGASTPPLAIRNHCSGKLSIATPRARRATSARLLKSPQRVPSLNDCCAGPSIC